MNMARTRKTSQKEAVSAEITRTQGLFAAQELLSSVRRRHPHIGQATIYRQLKEMARHGELHNFRHGRATLYSAHANNVVHFICERCGAMQHIKLARADFVGAVEKETGQKACHFQLDVFGTCAKCAKKRWAMPGK